MGLIDALADDGFRQGVSRGLLDAGNRGIVAGLLGAPVDAAAAAINLPLMATGYLGSKAGLLGATQLPQPITQPVGGSEWIGQRLQDAGLVSAERNPLAEGMAALVGPFGMAKAARAVPLVEADGLLGVLSRPAVGSRESMRGGPISAEGKARLLQDLQAGQPSGSYTLGTVTEGQAKALSRLMGQSPENLEVQMTPRALRHLVDRRVNKDGYTPQEVADFAEQAMAPRARAEIDPASRNQNPSLVAAGQRDPVTGQRYDARMPLYTEDGDLFAIGVVPDGLRPRKQKAP